MQIKIAMCPEKGLSLTAVIENVHELPYPIRHY